MADYSMANRKIAYTLGRGRAYISDMSSTSGYMGAKHFQEFGPIFFDRPSASGYMVATYVQKFGQTHMHACPLPRVYAVFLFAIEQSAKAQPPQHTIGACGGRWGATPGARTLVVMC